MEPLGDGWPRVRERRRASVSDVPTRSVGTRGEGFFLVPTLCVGTDLSHARRAEARVRERRRASVSDVPTRSVGTRGEGFPRSHALRGDGSFARSAC